MKALVLLLALAAGVWLWQRGRRLRAQPTRPAAAPVMLPMTRCRHCGLHLPAADAIQGASGVYCSLEHRRAAEGA